MNRTQLKPALEPHFRKPRYKGKEIPVTECADVAIGLILGAAYHANKDKGIELYNMCVLDMDDPQTPLTTIPMDFFGHGIVPDPARPELVSVFEKRGKGACEIDLKQGKMTRKITTADNRQFYGHGAYSTDGGLLYCTETIIEGDYAGVIAVRDAKTHEYLGEFPSFGSSPHDCHLIDDGKIMVVTNGGGKMDGPAPNVAYIDIEKQSLIERLEFDATHVNAGHLDITGSGKLAVVSAQRTGLPQRSLGGISIRQDGILRTLKEPAKLIERLYDESLSVCINENNGIMGATTPEGHLLSFWDMEDGSLLHYYIMQGPRGIELSLDGKYFVVSFGQGDPAEAICLIDADTLEHVQGMDLWNTGITGSHLTAYSLPAEMRQ